MAQTKHKTVDKLEELWNEILACEKKIETEVRPVYLDAIARYAGESFSTRFDSEPDVVLNDVFPIVQQKLPYLFFRKPRAFVKPRRKHVFLTKRNPVTGEREKVRVDGPKIAKTTEAAVNWSLHESGFEEEMDKISLDIALAPYAYLWQSYTGEFGIREDETMFIKKESVFQKRIRPDLFLWDIEGTCEEEWRWIGRKVLVRLEDVLDDPRYEKVKDRLKGVTGYGEKIRSSSQGADSKPLVPQSFSDIMSSDYKASVQSKRVWLYEIWVKPSLKERLSGKKGRVYVLAKDVSEPLLEVDWPLLQEGFPGELFRINPLNDTVVGIPDPKTYVALADEKQMETNLILSNLKQNTNLSVVLDGSKFDREDIQKFADGESKILISNQPLAQGSVTAITPGSVPSAAFQVVQNTDLQLQRQSSITSSRQGIKPPGEVTATQAEILERGLEARPTVHQKLIARSLNKLARKRVQLIKQFFKKKDIVPLLGTFDIEWSDEFSNDDITDEIDIEIDILSMLPENPSVEIRNLLDFLKLMSEAISNPAVYDKIQQEGRVFNFTPFIEQLLLRMNLRDEEMFRPIRPEEGEGFSPNSTLMMARQRAMQAVLTGQAELPQEGEKHDVLMSVYVAVKQMIEALGISSQSLDILIANTQAAMMAEEESSGARKEGTPIKGFSGNGTVPTRASEAARAQGRVQSI